MSSRSLSSFVLGCALVVSSIDAMAATSSCGLSSIVVDRTLASWGPLTIGSTQPEVERHLGRPLDLHTSSESEEKSARALVDGREVRLSFRDGEAGSRLESLTVSLTGEDPAACRTVAGIRAALRARFPHARYLPSRHDPEKTEEATEEPVFLLDQASTIVVQLRPADGVIYLGPLASLD